ncbi:phosphotransferase [Falsihalocynthiibacter arcticus]|uniref:Aminoglycoside phosphotransferase domain-containing protein n=1 Tax=Falsihalocynthiibacter arcticus TaxID=1579316 RepID=A0A126UYB4_9RHOB|nr:phosphotransferase [Falsihalocynthiibacter arcticus]AML51034.1 hypothetical protein RC74_06880 [Falsihalocynthiibacter arcticus]
MQTQLARELSQNCLVPSQAAWQQLSGGRTNTCWRIKNQEIDVVCKLFQKGQNNPLFPNSPSDEFSVLKLLERANLSPDPVAYQETTFGTCVLYCFLDGDAISGVDAGEVGKTLAQLHNTPIPVRTHLRKLSLSPNGVSLHGVKILDVCSFRTAQTHQKLMPVLPNLPAATPVLLHGDLVPANIIRTKISVRFIDWQCPALGDPCEDIATYLSPAMQYLYADEPLDEHQEAEFLRSYGNKEVIERYHILKPLYHWRMAAYCLWKAEDGVEDYAQGYALEMMALNRLV